MDRMPIAHGMPGDSYGEIFNPGQEHLPCAILLDVSDSMVVGGAIQQLEQGLGELRDALHGDDHCLNTVDTTIITFGNCVTIKNRFKSCSEMQIPHLEVDGSTVLYSAVNTALDEIAERRRQYRAEGCTGKRGWIFLLTDGTAADSEFRDAVLKKLADAEKKDLVTFFAVAIGNSTDRDELAAMSQSKVCLTADRDSFKSCFKWFSAAVFAASVVSSRSKIILPDVTQLTAGSIGIYQGRGGR